MKKSMITPLENGRLETLPARVLTYLSKNMKYIDVIPDELGYKSFSEEQTQKDKMEHDASSLGIKMVIPANVVRDYNIYNKFPHVTFGKYVKLGSLPFTGDEIADGEYYFCMSTTDLNGSMTPLRISHRDIIYDSLDKLYTRVIDYQISKDPNGEVAQLWQNAKDKMMLVAFINSKHLIK